MSDFQGDGTEYVGEHYNGVDASHSELRGKEFEGCNFKDCDFSEAQLRSCKFIECNFENCNLSLADFSYSRFSDVLFENCKLVGVDFTKLDWPSLVLCSPVNFKQCILNDASFFGLSLDDIIIEGCKAHDADFRDSSLCEANLTYTDFSRSLFSKTNLRNADLSEASRYDIDIHSCEIKGAKFCRDEAVNLLLGLGIELVD